MKVGDPNNDHKCWERVEDMDTLRTTYKIDTQNPGSDVATETVAALAAASLVFHRTDPSYSRRLIRASIMEFLIGEEKSFEDYKDHANSYIYSVMSGTSVMPRTSASRSKYTPGGLLYTLPEVNLQYVASASFLLMTYAKYLSSYKHVMSCGGMAVTSGRLREIEKGQVDYILGLNSLEMSYMVGYGSNYSQKIHHKGSSLPSVSHQFLNSDAPNRNILKGTAVGGPDANDQFPDGKHDNQHSKPTTYINAPLLGSLTYLTHCTTRS